MSTPLATLGIYAAMVLGLCATMLGLSAALGGRTRLSRAGAEPYESGIVATGGARYRMSSRFYLMAMFFVIFDLEAAYVFVWAVSAREAGWTGYVEMLVFLALLLLALAWLWKRGALDWNRPRVRETA